jgi:dTDP-4-dehydrorhamnose reductase
LGGNIVLQALGRCDVVAHGYGPALDAQGFGYIESDLLVAGEVKRLLREVRPNWVIHCAALADVDRCEKEPGLAKRVNAELAGSVARAAADVGARFLHISTDAVFDGQRGGYAESDDPRPVNRYGESKLEGERAVLSAHPDGLIVRTNFFTWPAPGREGLAGWILRRLTAGQEVPGFVDVEFNPIAASLLAGILLDMLAARLRGIYHVAGRTCLSKHDFALALARAMDFQTGLVTRSHSASADLAARRGGRLCLRVGTVERARGRGMPTLEQSLQHFRAEQANGYAEAIRAIRRPGRIPPGG